MDEQIATVLVAVLTGIFSLITIIIQKDQRKLMVKLDEHTFFMEKASKVKKKMEDIELQRIRTLHDIIQSYLSAILQINISHSGVSADKEILEINARINAAEDVYSRILKELDEAMYEYALVTKQAEEFNKMKVTKEASIKK